MSASHSRLTGLVWPTVALALLLALNLVHWEHGRPSLSTQFFELTVKDGHVHGSLVDILKRAAPVLLAALGMTFVLATGGVDLSVGAVIAISGAVAATMLEQTGCGVAGVAAAALAACLLAGLCNGLLVTAFGVQPIVATLVLMVAGRGAAQLLTDGQIVTFERPDFAFIGGGWWLGLPFAVTLAVAGYVVFGLLTRQTAAGLFIESVGGNERASRLAGVPVAAIKLAVYAASGLTAGVAGLIVAADIKAADANNAGLYTELDAILAAVIGGTALTGGRYSLPGTFIGGLLIQTLTTSILTRGVPVEYTLVVKALVVLGVCLLQSERIQGALRRRRPA